MAEWFKAPVLKTGLGQLNVGSNPSLSAETAVTAVFLYPKHKPQQPKCASKPAHFGCHIYTLIGRNHPHTAAAEDYVFL